MQTMYEKDNVTELVKPMGRVTDIIDNRPVFVLLHGKSIKQLEQYILQFKGKRICYASVNYFTIMEERILSKIGERISLLWASSPQNIQERMPAVNEFLMRKERNMLLTHPPALRLYNEQRGVRFLERFREKIWLDITPPRNLNSVLFLLPILAEEGAKTIILFGADGCVQGNRDAIVESYYNPEKYNDGRGVGIVRDTIRFNAHFPAVLKKMNGSGTRLLNCSPNSYLENIKKIRYEELHNYT